MRNRAALRRGSSGTPLSIQNRRGWLASVKVLTLSAELRLFLLILVTSVSAGFTACVADTQIAKQEAQGVGREDRVAAEEAAHSAEGSAPTENGIAITGPGHRHDSPAPRFLQAGLVAARSIGLLTIPLFVIGAILFPASSSITTTMRAVGLAVLLKTTIEGCVVVSGVLIGRPLSMPLLGSLFPGRVTNLLGEPISDVNLLVPVFALFLAGFVARLWRCSPLRSLALAAVVLIMAVAWSVATGHGHNATIDHYH